MHQRQPEQQIEPVRPVLEPRVEQRGEEDDREQEEQPGHAVGDRRVHDARRHQQVEQQDHREGQHEIGEERQDRVDPPAVIAGRQAERDADHQREGGRRRRDDQHDLAAVDHAAEHVAGQLVAAEQDRPCREVGSIAPGSASFMIGTWPSGSKGAIGRREDRGEQPEEADRHADDADAAVEQLAVEAEPLLVDEAGAKHDRHARPIPARTAPARRGRSGNRR